MSSHQGPPAAQTLPPLLLGGFLAPTCFSPRPFQRCAEGRLLKPSLAPVQLPRSARCCRERSEGSRARREGLGACGGSLRQPLASPPFPHPVGWQCPHPACPPAWAQQGPPEPSSSQPPPPPAAPTAPGRRADFINQAAEQPPPAPAAPQPRSRLPLQRSERKLVEKRLYAVSTKLCICYIRIEHRSIYSSIHTYHL